MDCRNAPVADSRHEQRYPPGAAANGMRGDSAVRALRRTSLILGALDGAVPCARLHARQVLWEWGLAPITETAELLISELVTNGLKASRATGWNPPISFSLRASQTALVIEVWDGNPHPPAAPDLHDDEVPPLEGEGGRGLFLVSTLSQGWGWYPTRNPEGKVTWCELQTATAPPSR
jgi:anti-sigma regulatory factor (Ser/Thr protein kinase)